MLRVMVVTAFALAVSLPFLPGSEAVAQGLGLPKGETRVTRVIDGDTIAVSDLKATIRLKGFDAPEIHKSSRSGYKCEAERQLGLKAKARLEELVAPPHKVVVRRSGQFDEYGRRVAVVTSDGQDVGPILIGEGLAKEWSGSGPKPDWCGGTPVPTPAPVRPQR